jgi:hypothetical protein
MIIEVKIDTRSGETYANAVVDSMEDHASAAQMLQRISPTLNDLQRAVLHAQTKHQTKESTRK